jgi:iron complex outermembrane recepter protein
MVTAQRRAQRLQDVPVSVQVIGELTRMQANINSLHDLPQIVPAVHIGTAGRSSELFIRGIGSGNNQSFDQSVGMFIDDIYHGRSRTSSATFLDLDRVEVLKGPQSTFFGNNAIAGALNIVSRKPGIDVEPSFRALYGESGQYALEGAMSHALSETLALRGAVTFNGSNGWLKNVYTGRDQPEQRNIAGRLTLRFSPEAELAAILKVEGSHNRNKSGLFFQIADCPPPPPFTAAGFCNSALGLGLPIGIDDERNSASPGQSVDLDTFDNVLTINYSHSRHTFTSVTGYYEYKYNLNLDTDGVPLDLLHAQAPETYHQLSQEFRIASPADEPVEYLGGVYFHADKLFFRTDQNYFFLTPSLIANAALAPYLPLGQTVSFAQDENTYSAFGSVTWKLNDQLSVNAGVRGSWVDKNYEWSLRYGTATQSYGGITPLPASVAALPEALGLGVPGALEDSRSDHAWMPSAKVQYKLASDVMAYASYARGFKGGGFNGADNTAVLANLPFSPEHVDAYEIGLKSEWLEHRLLLNLAVFRSDYDDLQVAVNLANAAGTFVSLVRNAAASRSEGMELESLWAISPNLRLTATATYLDARYLSYPNVSLTAAQQLRFNQCLAAHPVPDCEPLRFQDLSGRPTQYAPDWSGTVSGTYSAKVLGHFIITSELTTGFSTEYYIAPTLDEGLRQGGYARLDSRFTFESSRGNWAVDLIGKNLTSRKVLSYGSNLPASLGSLLLQKEQPRNAALQFRYQW